MKMRNKLKNLELNSVIARIRENEKEPKDADLLTQFDVYDRMAAKDAQEYAEIEFIDGVHLSDPRSVFERVLQKAKGAKAESSLLTILQHLLLIPNEENVCPILIHCHYFDKNNFVFCSCAQPFGIFWRRQLIK